MNYRTQVKYERMAQACFLFVIGIIILAVSSCAPGHFTPIEKKIYTSFKTLEAANTFRVTGLQAAGDFWRQGLIDIETKYKIIAAGDDLQRAINSAGKALKIYHEIAGTTPTGDYDLQKKLMVYQQMYGVFVDLVMPYILQGD